MILTTIGSSHRSTCSGRGSPVCHQSKTKPSKVEPFTWHESIYELEAGLGLAVCVAHRGIHPAYLGECVAFPVHRQPKRLRVALTRQDRPEPAPEPVRVELDESRLAAGIAMALDALMQRRREERARPNGATAEGPPANDSRGFIPVKVWGDDGSR